MWEISIGRFQIIIRSGGLIPLLIMLPNFLWMAFPGPPNPQGQGEEPVWLTIVENIGRTAVLLLPFFFKLDFERKFSIRVGVLMGLLLILYYVAWIRYFSGERLAILLKNPLLGIPLPMAVFPVIVLLLSSYLMNSWMMFAACVLFGAAHLWISATAL